MNHQIELISPKGNNQQWIIRGVATEPETLAFLRGNAEYGTRPTYAEQIGVNEEKDVILWSVGQQHTCDSVPSIVAALFGALYDEYQCNPAIRQGDEFFTLKCKANCYHSYNAHFGSFTIPALRFVADGVEIVPADSATKALLNAYQQISSIDPE